MASIINRTLASAPGSYATAAEVRSTSGLSSTNDISDSDLNDLILGATLHFIRDVVVRVDSAVLRITDTARKTFRAPRGLMADQNGDATVDTNDVTVRFLKINDDGTISTTATGTITVHDSEFGVIVTANALPEDYTAVIDYAYYLRPLELALAKRAVRYLAAHLAYVRVKGPGKITRADLTGLGASNADDGNRAMHITKQRTKWLDLYRQELARVLGIGLV